MSCECQLIASLEGIKKFIDGDNLEHTDNESDSSRKTLQSFKIAVSPTGEMVAFAKATWLLICESKWDPSITNGPKIKYSPNWHGHVNCKTGEKITSILCLPFFSQGHSTHGCADWTCIVLGFSSGWIRLYTEGMQELGSCLLHEETITDVKCPYSATAQERKTQKQDNNDIYVLYKTVICVINRSQLSQALIQKRNQLAKGALIKNNEAEGYLSLDVKKYTFVSQEEVTDACFLGQTLVSSFNTFDHLVTASLVGGFNSNYKASPPQTSLIITSGRRPFVGFHYTLEGTNSPVLTDVALAVASKIKNSMTSTLPDWLNFGTKKAAQTEKPKEVSREYAECLSCRFGLCDIWRQGQSVIVSPDGMFSAVTDSLGRVTLIDNNSGIAHQMWKGYRDAQCGFLQVQEDIKLKRDKGVHSKSQPRQGLFIVIYAPKKGLIEIFTTQHGRCVGTFKVTKFGHLLYIPGASVTSTCAGGFNLSQNQVIFVSEEGFNVFTVPFYCALTGDNCKISKDLHVLRKIKMLLKMESNADNSQFIEEIKKCASELKTDEVRLQAIESMITYRNVTLEAFKVVLKVFLEAFLSKERASPPPQKVLAFAEETLNLLLFYDFLLNSSNQPMKSEDNSENSGNLASLSEQLRLPENELDNVLKVIAQITETEKINQQCTKVAFDEKKTTKLTQFLTCFDFETFLNCLHQDEKEDKKESPKYFLNLRSSEKMENLSYLGEVFFKILFNSSVSCIDKWKTHLESCCLNPKDLSLCLLAYWCCKKISDDIFHELGVFLEVLKIICVLNGPDTIVVEYNRESPWWKQLRNFLAGNPFTIHGLFAALCCRSITIFLEQERELSFKQEKKITSKANEGVSLSETMTLNNDWETLSKDSCQWDILIMQLQDVALLNAILSLNFKTGNKLPEIPFDFERQSLTSIQASGTGRVSELTAKWLIQFGFEPSALIDPNDIEFQLTADDREVDTEESDLILEIDRTKDLRSNPEGSNLPLTYLALLKTRFPYSLTSSSLLGNMCWEYFAHWFKNVSDIVYLESAVRYLEVIPSNRIKYGICYLSWNSYLEQKFEALAKIINRIGKVPVNSLCVQEIGLRNDQVSSFLKLSCEVLMIMLHTDVDDKTDLGNNREVLWQSSCSPVVSSLAHIAFAQPVISSDLILLPLQLCHSLLMISALNLKQQKLFTVLFDNVENMKFTLVGVQQLSSHSQNLKLIHSRTEFLKKCLSAAVQTIELVEYIPPVSSNENLEVVPTTVLKVEEYKKWFQLCFKLANMWAVPLDDLRRHQICELYFSGFDRLAEEVIPCVDSTAVLASQLLVIGGKRLKYLIQDSKDFSKKLTKLSANLSEWLHTLDLEDFTYQGSTDDIEVLMRFIAKWLPEGHSDHKLAVEIVESLLFLKLKGS